MACFVVVLKEACRGFSHIRNAEQLGSDKRIIYTEALKGKGKLSSLVSAHTDKYKCTHEASLTQSSMWTTARTHQRTIVHLSSSTLYSERQWRDLTWHFKAYCCCQLSCHSQTTRAVLSQGEFFGEVKGGGGGQLVWYDKVRGGEGPLCVHVAPLFLVTVPGWKALRGEARPGQDSALLHCKGQLHSEDGAQNRSAKGQLLVCWGSMKTMLEASGNLLGGKIKPTRK